MAKRKNEYLNNKKLYECILEYRKLCDSLALENKPLPPIPDYAGECIQLLCTRMSSRYNFQGYSYRSELCSDAILDCINAFHNFDPYRFNNPFGYFSRVGWMAMIRRIYTEKRETYVKHKSLMNAYISGEQWDTPEGYMDPGGERIGGVGNDGPCGPGMSVSEKVVTDFEDLLERRKKPKVKKGSES